MTPQQQAQADRLSDALSDFRDSLMAEFHNTNDEDRADTLDRFVDVMFDAQRAVDQARALL